MKYIAIFLVLMMTLGEVAEARSRFKRSFGRRASRSFFHKKNKTTPFKRDMTKRNSQSQRKMGIPSRSRRPSFLTTMAGAFAGTMIGSMLFRALGISPAGGGGFMLILLVLFGFGAYFLFKRRYGLNYATEQGAPQTDSFVDNITTYEESMGEIDELDMVNNPDFMTERSRDFFSIQHAWSKKDLGPVKHLMTTLVEEEFQKEIDEMKSNGVTSTLENLMIERTQVVSSWNELEMQCATIKFDVSLIEYETNEQGEIVNGSKDQHTRITEYWTFSKSPSDENWKVCAVENP